MFKPTLIEELLVEVMEDGSKASMFDLELEKLVHISYLSCFCAKMTKKKKLYYSQV